METNSEKIRELKEQKKSIIFDSFSSKSAFAIGRILLKRAEEKGVAYTVSISVNRKRLFFVAMDGTSPDHEKWASRKENTVYHFFASSYRMRLQIDELGYTLSPRFGLHDEEYVLEGGGFPITVKGTGVIGAIAVSGLAEEDDHNAIVSACREYLDATQR